MVALVIDPPMEQEPIVKRIKLPDSVLLGDERKKAKIMQHLSKVMSSSVLFDYFKLEPLINLKNKIPSQIKFCCEDLKVYPSGIPYQGKTTWDNKDFLEAIRNQDYELTQIEVASYPSVPKIQIKKENVPAISVANNPEIILNKEAIMFPQNIEDIPTPLKKRQTFAEDEDRLSFIRSRREESNQLQEGRRYTGGDEDQSITVSKLRELVIRFEKLLNKWLDPDIPTGRKARKKFMEEREMFRVTGYKDFINSIDLKVDALCSFEGYLLSQFCKGDQKNWFKGKVASALNGDFYSAQEIVNSVMQIVKEEEYAVPKRRVVTKLK